MGLNSNKKDGMALVLILVILASLMVVVAGSLKVITSLNPSYSINRNATGMHSSKISGSYLCYKEADGKIKYKRVDYNPDGTYESKEGDNCNFKVPIGASEFDVYILGPGGKGAQSSYTIVYDDVPQTKNLKLASSDEDEALKKVLSKIVVSIKANPMCNGKPSGYKIECPFLNNNQNLNLSKFYNEYLKNKKTSLFDKCPQNKKNLRCVDIGGAYNIATNKGTLMPTWEYVYRLKMDGKKISEFTINESDSRESDKIVRKIEDALKDYSIKVHEPSYDVNIGSAGEPGELIHIQLKGNIFVSNKNDVIKITKDDIADGKKITETKFRYEYQASLNNPKTIEKVAHSGKSGEPFIKKTYKKIDNLYAIESQEGVLPQDFNIPSAIKFKENLYPGYIDEAGKPKDATYFGASGASGYLNFDKDEKFKNCTYIELFNKNSGSSDIIDGNKNCSEEKEPVFAEGSNGAPGAILIKW